MNRNDPQLLVVSAHTADSLRKRIAHITTYASNHRDRMCDLSHTLGTRREHLSHRAFAVFQPSKPVLEDTAFTSSATASSSMVFVFTGQGAQWPEMGKALLEESSIFRQDIKKMDVMLQGLPDFPCWLLYGKSAKPLDFKGRKIDRYFR